MLINTHTTCFVELVLQTWTKNSEGGGGVGNNVRHGETIIPRGDIHSWAPMSGGTIVPRNECPGGQFFQGDSHASDTGNRSKDS